MAAITFIVDCMPNRFKSELGQLRHTTEAAPIAVAWVTWVGSLLLPALISHVSYAVIERPARAWIRALLAPRRAPMLTAPGS